MSVLFQLSHMLLLQAAHSLLILSFDLGESHVPVLIEFLVLLDVRLLYFFPFSCLVVDQLFSSALEILGLQLLNPVLSHFSL